MEEENKYVDILIGSHVSMNSPKFFLGSVEMAIENEENTFMFYTGAPQNSIRTPLNKCKIEEGLELIKESNIKLDKVVVHAPYLINLGNIDSVKNQLSRNFLLSEINRTNAFNVKYIVLHPGLHVNNGVEVGLNSIIESLNDVFNQDNSDVIVCLETMAGKGSELGKTFDELAFIINHVDKKEKLGVCLDTCHINDAGYDVNDVDGVLDEFNKIIGLDKLKVIHLNDSKNIKGSHKDRHENIGFGTIGFETLRKWATNERLKDIPKILETPYVNEFPLYKKEIRMLKSGVFNENLKEELK